MGTIGNVGWEVCRKGTTIRLVHGVQSLSNRKWSSHGQPGSNFQRPRRTLTFAPFQVVEIRASPFKLLPDIFDFALLPDTGTFVGRFGSGLVQTTEDGDEAHKDGDERQGR